MLLVIFLSVRSRETADMMLDDFVIGHRRAQFDDKAFLLEVCILGVQGDDL